MKQINSQKFQNKLRTKFIKSGVQMIGPETIFFSKDTKVEGIDPQILFPNLDFFHLIRLGHNSHGTSGGMNPPL